MFTVVVRARDTTRSYPIMLTRTPYGVGPYGADAYPRAIGPSPRIFRRRVHLRVLYPVDVAAADSAIRRATSST